MPIRQLRFIMFGLITTLIVSYGVTSARSSSFNVPASSGLPLVIGARFDHVGAMTNANHSNSVANPQGQNIASEIESNNLPILATPLLTGSVIEGNIFPAADVDYFQFSATAGDRVYAATMTSFSPSSSDTVLDVLAANGTTVVENDDEDGSLSSNSSSVAGTVITTTGSYYLRVRGFSATNLIFPYRLYLKLQSGTPVAEAEPNNNGAPQPLPPIGWVTGTINPAVDTDTFSLALNAGDSVFLSLDADPERDGTTWNPRLGIGLFGNVFLAVDDENITSPNSEAQFMTVKASGVYTVYVLTAIAGASGPSQTYNLSVAVLPVQVQANCTTYTSTDAPKTLGPGTSVSRSTLTIPANVRIDDLDVTIALTHTAMADLDVTLSAPSGVTSNTVGLFSDIGASTSIFMNVTLDDEAAMPAGVYTINNGTVFQPERDYRLGWFDGQNAAGTWTLSLYDDTANAADGRLQGWSMRVCGTSPPPASSCPAGTIPSPIYSNNFEANDGGFTHSGTADEWAWGTPIAAPINTSYSGTKSWKTDLAGTYNASSNQDLLSPAFDLTAYSGMPVYVSWAQKYQIESTQFDHVWVDVQAPGGSNARRLWQWFGPTMTTAVGDPSITVQESAGWGVYTRDISAYVGQTAQLRFHLDSNATTQLAGLGVDDVHVVVCVPQLTTTPTTMPTNTATARPTNTATALPTNTATALPTNAATALPTNTATALPTTTTVGTPTITPTQRKVYLPLISK